MQHQTERDADEHGRKNTPAAKTAGGGKYQRRKLDHGNKQVIIGAKRQAYRQLLHLIKAFK